MLLQPGSFTWLLTQGIHTTYSQPLMPVPPQVAANVHQDHNVGDYSIQMPSNNGPSTLLGYSTAMHTSSLSFVQHMPENKDIGYTSGECGVPTSQYRRTCDVEWVDHCDVKSVCSRENTEDEDDDDTLRGELYLDDEDWDIGGGGPSGRILSPDGRCSTQKPIPNFMETGLGNDGSIMRNVIVPQGDVWIPAVDEFKVGMLFDDKKSLQHAVRMYHAMKN
ncbi:hypothetical protein L1049_021858 [Liquidambar formosana]|uniref:Uncharacterized protein n=1 Tax=Liquidambar formosana TaxID=63359 RepID=A0AAP0RBL9_LIQFO